MEKPKTTIYHWKVSLWDGHYNLSGTAEDHPRMGRNAAVGHTSKMLSASLENDVFIYETRNTVYLCPLKFMSTDLLPAFDPEGPDDLIRMDQSEKVIDRIISAETKMALSLESDDPFLLHIKDLQKEGQEELLERRKQEESRLMNEAGKYEDCIYLEVMNLGYNTPLAYHIGEKSGIIYPQLHLGMTQDSVLYRTIEIPGEKGNFLDFRYFPLPDGMKTYSWTLNIHCAVIKNEMNAPFSFNGNEVAAGETKVFPRS